MKIHQLKLPELRNRIDKWLKKKKKKNMEQDLGSYRPVAKGLE